MAETKATDPTSFVQQLPRIDLDDATAVEDIKLACQTFGFFYVRHSLSALAEVVLREESNFFSLPTSTKFESICNASSLGYTSYQDETIAPEVQTCGDTKEGYYIGAKGRENRWPAETSVPGWKDVMEEYHEECAQLGARIVSTIALALGQPADFFASLLAEPTTLLRLIKYSLQPSDPASGVYGTGPHTDYGLVTLLATNGVSGLQINLNGEWLPVPTIPGHLIVNLGDCLQRITNDRMKSTLHRVIIEESTEEHKYSAAYFFEPSKNAIVQPLPCFMTAEGQETPHYDPISYGDYLARKYDKTQRDFKIAAAASLNETAPATK